MRRLHRVCVAALVAGTVTLAGASLPAQEDYEPGRNYPAADWPFAGGDWTSSRHSTLADVTTENVDRLGAAWVARLPGGVSSRATPVVDDGVLYLTGGANVFAVDGRTGDTVWRWGGGHVGRGRGAGAVVAGRGPGRRAGLRRAAQRGGGRPATGDGRADLGGAGREHTAASWRSGDHGADARAGHRLRGARERRQRRAGARHRPRRGHRRATLDVLRRAAAGGDRP